MQKWEINTLEELEVAAREVWALGASREASGAAVLALSGDLGTGKTTFTQTLARLLGVNETVTSPTFVIMKRYQTKGDFKSLVHIDAYRIEDVDEMRVLGFADILKEKDTIIVIEWAEKIAPLLPGDTLKLQFDLDNDVRTLTLND